jgi:hypothetical protein
MDIESVKQVLADWEDALDGASADAEYDAALAMADVLRAIAADHDLRKEQA